MVKPKPWEPTCMVFHPIHESRRNGIPVGSYSDAFNAASVANQAIRKMMRGS